MRINTNLGLVRNLLLSMGLVSVFVGQSAMAQDVQRQRDQVREQQRISQDEPIYGSQLMTEQERNAYREQMRNAKTLSERERLREEHHERMKDRAKQRGVSIPDNPPPKGPGTGWGPGHYGPGSQGR